MREGCGHRYINRLVDLFLETCRGVQIVSGFCLFVLSKIRNKVFNQIISFYCDYYDTIIATSLYRQVLALEYILPWNLQRVEHFIFKYFED